MISCKIQKVLRYHYFKHEIAAELQLPNCNAIWSANLTWTERTAALPERLHFPGFTRSKASMQQRPLQPTVQSLTQNEKEFLRQSRARMIIQNSKL